MSELGVVAYGWIVPVEPSKNHRKPGERYAVSPDEKNEPKQRLLSFSANVTPDMLEVSDESRLKVPWRASAEEVQNLHPEHQKLFWEDATPELFRGKELIVPKRSILLSRRQYFKFIGGKEAAIWADSAEEAGKILEALLR